MQNVNVHICLHNFSPLLFDDKKHQTLAAGGTNLQKNIHKCKMSRFLCTLADLQFASGSTTLEFLRVNTQMSTPINQQETTHFLENGTLLVFGFYWPKFHVELF